MSDANKTLAEQKRDMARRARRLALTQANDDDRARLIAFAEECEAEAIALESVPPAAPSDAAVTQIQQQLQQQHSGPPQEGKKRP